MKRRRKKAATAPAEVDINVLLDAIAAESLVDEDEQDLTEAHRVYQPLRQDFSIERLRADRKLDGDTE